MSGGPEVGDRRFVGHARTVMALTLTSRVSGLLRDAVTSRVFGASPLWSAFLTAFVVPNLFRRLFGEGALSASFIPPYARLSESDPAQADRFASLTVLVFGAALAGVVLLIELPLVVVLLLADLPELPRWTLTFLAVMLPYAPLVCQTAMLGGMLQTRGRFAPHASAPIILNVLMTAGASGAWLAGWPAEWTALTVAGAVLTAGVLQAAWCGIALRGLARWRRDVSAAAGELRSMLAKMLPVVLGMGALQIGTLIDGLLAGWPVLVGPTIPFSGGEPYPLDGSAKSVLFFADRLYQFPLGVFGIAVATAVFPALSRMAGDPAGFAATLSRGLRTSLFIGVPAAVGLALVARPLAATVYGGGAFDADALDRTAAALLCYAPAVWAMSLTHVLNRAFFAAGDTRTPMRVGIATVGANITLNVVLMFPLAERGLALATATAAIGQTAALLVLARRRLPGGVGGMGSVGGGALWSVGLAAAMAGAILLARLLITGPATITADADGAPVLVWSGFAVDLARDVAAGVLAYGGLAAAARRPELRWLLTRGG